MISLPMVTVGRFRLYGGEIPTVRRGDSRMESWEQDDALRRWEALP